MNKLLIVLLSLLSLSGFTQTTPLSVTVIPTTDPDLNRPFGGANEWYQANDFNYPNTSFQTQRLDGYWRFEATDVTPYNNASGVYYFNYFASIFNTAVDRKQKMAFGIMNTCCGKGATSVGGAALNYPLWIHNIMQASGQKDYIDNGVWVPNYDNTSWIAFRKAMHQAVNNYLNTTSYKGVYYKDIVTYIDALEYGDYGEWVNLHGASPSVAHLDSILNGVVFSYPDQQVNGQPGMFDAGQSGFVNQPAALGYYALNVANNKGKIGISDLCLGCLDWFRKVWLVDNATVYSGMRFDTAIQNRYKTAPMSGEPPGFVQNVSGSNDPDLNGLPARITWGHVATFGNSNWGRNTTALQANARAAFKIAGHRLIINPGTNTKTTTSPATGGNFITSLDWINVNGIPTYEDWNVVFRLKSGTTVLQTWTSKFKPKLFYSTSAVTVVDTVVLTSVPGGSGYTLNMTIEDPKAYRFPLPVFITGVKSDGSYDLRTGITVSSSGAAVAYAGTDQTITLPTSFVTLSSTGSTGTITTYSWTKTVGGTATISSPSSSSTTVTGLAAGFYTFKLTLNGGSNASVNVFVNPPVPPASNLFTSQIPVSTTDNDYPGNTAIQGIAFGVRFKSSIPGYITGVRFYKTAGNLGVHVGELYTNTGTRMAQATFTGETATGWQNVTFSSPVLIAANTNYIASVWSAQGYYVEDNDFFLNNTLINRTLSASADGTNGATGTDPGNGQGFFLYTASPAFPNQLYRSSNYYVDPDFNMGNPGGVTIPKVSKITFQKVP